MKSKKISKKKNINNRMEEEIRIREKKKITTNKYGSKYGKKSIYSMIEDEEEDFDLYIYNDEYEQKKLDSNKNPNSADQNWDFLFYRDLVVKHLVL